MGNGVLSILLFHILFFFIFLICRVAHDGEKQFVQTSRNKPRPFLRRRRARRRQRRILQNLRQLRPPDELRKNVTTLFPHVVSVNIFYRSPLPHFDMGSVCNLSFARECKYESMLINSLEMSASFVCDLKTPKGWQFLKRQLH